MLTWIIALTAILLWTAATLLYLRGPILRRVAAWRKRRAALAKARQDAKGA